MTAMSEFDRLLGSVIAADGPQSVPASLVEGALGRVRTLPQRRPLISVFDRRAWPAGRLSFGDPRTTRLVRLGVVAMLTLALVAVALAVAANRTPTLLGSGERLLVGPTAGGVVHIFGNDGGTAQVLAVDGCAHLVPGSTLIAGQRRFAGIRTFDLADPTHGLSTSSIGTSNSEFWSPDGRRVALVDFGGTITVLTFGAAEPQTRTFSVPGMIGRGDWSLDGTRLAWPRAVDGNLELEVIDVATGDEPTTHRVGAWTGNPDVIVDWSSDASRVALWIKLSPSTAENGSPTSLVFLDLEGDAEPTLVDQVATVFFGVFGAWTRDGSHHARNTDDSTIRISDASGHTVADVEVAPGPPGQTGPNAGDLAWSPDGRTLAFRESELLVLVDRDGSNRRSLPIGPTDFRWPADADRRDLAIGWSGFLWTTDSSGIIVASQIRFYGGASVGRYAASDLTPIVRADSWLPGAEPSASSSGRFTALETGIGPCMQLDPGTAGP